MSRSLKLEHNLPRTGSRPQATSLRCLSTPTAPVMAATLAVQENAGQYDQGEKKAYPKTIPPMIRDLLQDLSNIRMTMLTESPQMLPLIAPSLIEAEVHVRQLWQSQL
jgi:hypothetical protein